MKMSLAIHLADIKQKAFNRQYHVMLLELPQGDRLVSINKEEINRFKRKKWLPKKATMLDLRESIFYSTPLSRNNKAAPKDRKKAKEKYLKYTKRYRFT